MLHKHLLWITIGYGSLVAAQMDLSALSKTTKEPQQAVDVGSVNEVTGFAQIERDEAFAATPNFVVQSYDKAQTEAGRMGIRFVDDTTIKITENSTVIIDEFVFDPDPSKSKLAVNFLKGTARFTTGLTGKVAKENMILRTNSATVGIRGTDFSVTVNSDTSESLFILLPDQDGAPSGEISVTTNMGTVILNQAFQATTTTTLDTAPTDPVILDLSLDFIDNMLIVSPPKKTKDFLEDQESTDSVDPILDFNELDIDYLAEENLGEEGLEFTELDYDALNVNFLEDLLDIISELDRIDDEDQLAQEATSTNIKGTLVGQDTKTQITTIVTGEKIKMTRAVGSSAAINIDSGNSYTVVLEQNGVVNEVKVNGGSSSTIVIRQSSG
tara:strand:- start:420 stop:1571 length:1152 start_codon:yes stop_codon:yes gene_type:complete